jgi:hypothetical protein
MTQDFAIRFLCCSSLVRGQSESARLVVINVNTTAGQDACCSELTYQVTSAKGRVNVSL